MKNKNLKETKTMKVWAVIKKGKILDISIVRDIDYCECGNVHPDIDGLFICRTKKEAVENSKYDPEQSVVPVTITFTTHDK